MTSALHTSPYTAPAGKSGGGTLEAKLRAAVTRELLDWYGRRHRPLPWRATRDPYCIWVSEVMLQQTQVATVIGFYERWLRRFPDVAALAAADTEDVLRAWEGLGYYSRARNLQRAAQHVVEKHGGKLPASVDALLELPGIGRYSAGAIASIAFAADEPAIDGNIVRVLTRLFGLRGDPKRAPLAGRLWELARELLPRGRAGEFNQALMELGATVCTPRAPACAGCPVRAHCRALEQNRVLEYPESSARPAVTQERRALALVRRQGRVLVVRAPADAARWAGMWQFPDVRVDADGAASAALEAGVARATGVRIGVGERAFGVRHQVTRFRIDIDVFICRALGGRARAVEYAEVRWHDVDALVELPMPAAHRRIAKSLAEQP
ncbi:MAG TPA: A/G-specific adenine glycosylase [Polyangiaceae bacterium]|nr:A/G-specific adenine glycosylase [Polyangiaceae bacterium]